MVAVKRVITNYEGLYQRVCRLLEDGYTDIEIHAPKCPHEDRYGVNPNMYLIKAFNKRAGKLTEAT
jgi:hypothetical protein